MTPAAAVEATFARIVADVKRIVQHSGGGQSAALLHGLRCHGATIEKAGADALVLFNRFHQADIDTTTMKVTPRVALSTNSELLLRLRWLAILHGRIRTGFAVTGGVSVPDDGIKAILAGADVVQMVSALLRHGPTYLDTMRGGLERWMELHKLDSLDEVRGRASLRRNDSTAVERAQYLQTLQSWGR